MAVKDACLVIDTATQKSFVFVVVEWQVVDSFVCDEPMMIFDFLKAALEKYFFSKMVFCEGPGRVISIRIAMLFLRSYASLMEGVSTFSYTSLGFAMETNNAKDTIICSKGMGNFFSLERGSDVINSIGLEEVKVLDPRRTAFLQTKPEVGKGLPNFDFANYDPMAGCITALRSTRSNCMARSLFDSVGEFSTWKGERHR
ncbi:MAG: hypothetical protein LBI37_00135 [Puniceicoccales bacterium]|jgi:tRNA A37 threonylcarbamoyladenosine modification protein TsaB|nr:hypothetical protein [Puniceicoccales bacterium]